MVVRWVKNIVGKEENPPYQHFLPLPQSFQKAFFFPRLVKFRVCAVKSYPLPDDKNLDRPKLKQSSDDNFKFHNSRKFSKRVENTGGKGENARYEQFLLFPQYFQKACFPGASKGVIMWEWVKC